MKKTSLILLLLLFVFLLIIKYSAFNNKVSKIENTDFNLPNRLEQTFENNADHFSGFEENGLEQGFR
ncbi:hypothetical protein [Dyadobacter frigoris]|uniref:Uncharacterized protein n=1 Tax=Dyadobacter frigoris TaxID=2576211 RepID=A0A4U6CW03_9BACT|nr:hypothetical protein [Dyadobacter frigoris]TKT88862.1 hypothetical protein FDK13_24800 [Dyadobacter frigoris]GLU56052.1 hypothetical protein Dfri01_55130 [Dyadobacter frigoris]